MSNVVEFKRKPPSADKCANCGKDVVGLGQVTAEATQCAGMCQEMAALHAPWTTDSKPVRGGTDEP